MAMPDADAESAAARALVMRVLYGRFARPREHDDDDAPDFANAPHPDAASPRHDEAQYGVNNLARMLQKGTNVEISKTHAAQVQQSLADVVTQMQHGVPEDPHGFKVLAPEAPVDWETLRDRFASITPAMPTEIIGDVRKKALDITDELKTAWNGAFKPPSQGVSVADALTQAGLGKFALLGLDTSDSMIMSLREPILTLTPETDDSTTNTIIMTSLLVVAITLIALAKQKINLEVADQKQCEEEFERFIARLSQARIQHEGTQSFIERVEQEIPVEVDKEAVVEIAAKMYSQLYKGSGDDAGTDDEKEAIYKQRLQRAEKRAEELLRV
jgi:hypothetical protein